VLCEQWAKIEKEVGGGQVEEMLYDARAELNLIGDYIGTQPLPLLPSPTTFSFSCRAVPNAVSDRAAAVPCVRLCVSVRAEWKLWEAPPPPNSGFSSVGN
jgi:hypothetical protein